MVTNLEKIYEKDDKCRKVFLIVTERAFLRGGNLSGSIFAANFERDRLPLVYCFLYFYLMQKASAAGVSACDKCGQ